MIPDVAPAIIDFFLDDDARLWVLGRTPDSDSLRTLDAYDAEDGQWLGTMTTDLTIVPNPPAGGARGPDVGGRAR